MIMFDVCELFYNRWTDCLEYDLCTDEYTTARDAIYWASVSLRMSRKDPVFMVEVWIGEDFLWKGEKPRALAEYWRSGLVPEK